MLAPPDRSRDIPITPTMQATNVLQNSWFLWNECWANDLLAMCECTSRCEMPACLDLTRDLAMAILCSQQISNIVWLLYRQHVAGNGLTVTSPDFLGTLELASAKKFSWNQLLLNLGYAVQFPITTAFHPLVFRPDISDWTLFPSLPHLVGQITVFLMIDSTSWQFFAKRYKEIFEDGDRNHNSPISGASSALEVATDFTASGTTLVFAITIIQLSSRLRCFTGSLHFGAIIGWLLIRTLMQPCYS